MNRNKSFANCECHQRMIHFVIYGERKRRNKTKICFQINFRLCLDTKQFFMNYSESERKDDLFGSREKISEYSFSINFVFLFQWHQPIWNSTFETISQFPLGISGKYHYTKRKTISSTPLIVENLLNLRNC